MMAVGFDRGGALIDGAFDRSRGSIANTFDWDRGSIAGTFDRDGALINHTIGGSLGQMASVLGARVQAG
jgi:hypothetical protein